MAYVTCVRGLDHDSLLTAFVVLDHIFYMNIKSCGSYQIQEVIKGRVVEIEVVIV